MFRHLRLRLPLRSLIHRMDRIIKSPSQVSILQPSHSFQLFQFSCREAIIAPLLVVRELILGDLWREGEGDWCEAALARILQDSVGGGVDCADRVAIFLGES